MASLRIGEDVYWVGVLDWNLRDFHGLTTPAGSTYNAYLVMDEKVTLIDTSDPRFFSDMIDRIREIVDPGRIDYIISNHAEPDHAGSIARLKQVAKNAKVIATGIGVKRLREYHKADLDFVEVKDQESLSIGRRDLKFIHAPMLHWPETMFTYLADGGILFSCDAFGAHLATSQRFSDQIGRDEVLQRAKEYYAMLVSPFSKNVLSAFSKVADLDIKTVAPSHGPIWRQDIGSLVDAYKKWASHELEDKVVIVYATMWGSTEKMARSIYEGVVSEGADAAIYNLDITDWSAIMADVITSKVVLVGSPTYVGGIYPRVEGFLSFLRIPNDSKKIASFGSYGWSGGSVRRINDWAEANRFQTADPGLQIQFIPDEKGEEECFDFGKRMGKLAKS